MEFPLLGIPEIDEQHKQLVENLEQLQQWRSKGHGYAAAINAFMNLGDYVQKHFQDEEEYMRRHDYPELDAHMLQHKDLIARIQEIEQHLMGGEDVTDEMIELLTRWIVGHIGYEDLKIATHREPEALA